MFPSIYHKECLPTWDQMYNEFFLNKMFTYDPASKDQQDIDPYWKRPHRKMLLGWACNQLNKMIFEDKVNVVPFANEEFKIECDEVRFTLTDDKLSSLQQTEEECIEKGIPPPIIECDMPSSLGMKSLFSTGHPSVNIDMYNYYTYLTVCMYKRKIPQHFCTTTYHKFQLFQVIAFVMKSIITYFERGIGWKDEHGNVIPSEPASHNCQGAGIDPAL